MFFGFVTVILMTAEDEESHRPRLTAAYDEIPRQRARNDTRFGLQHAE
jgi:hypothetical protein